MINPWQSHVVEVPLHPTHAQAQILLRLSAAHRATELLAMDQAYLALRGKDVSLSALVGGPAHPDRSPAAEAAVLATTPQFAGCPPSVLEYAISSYGSLLRQCKVHNYQDLPRVSASRVTAGHGLVRPAGPSTFVIETVGEVRADLTRLPDWARTALEVQRSPDESLSMSTEQSDLEYSGCAYVEREWDGVDWEWTVELDFVWT